MPVTQCVLMHIVGKTPNCALIGAFAINRTNTVCILVNKWDFVRLIRGLKDLKP